MSIVQYKRQGAVTADGALDHLARVADSGKIEVESVAALGRILGWSRPRASKALKAWQTAGAVTLDRAGGKLVVQIVPGVPTVPVTVPADRAGDRAEARYKRAGDRAQARRADRAETLVEDAGHGVRAAVIEAGEALARIAHRAGAEHRAAEIEPASTVPLPALPDLSGMPREMPARLFETPATVSTVPAAGPVAVPAAPPLTASVTPAAPSVAGTLGGFTMRTLLFTAGVALAMVAVAISATGYVDLFPGWAGKGLYLGIVLEAVRLLAAFALPWVRRNAGIVIVAMMACIYLTGELVSSVAVFTEVQLAHQGDRPRQEAEHRQLVEEQDDKIERQQMLVDQLARDISGLDSAISVLMAGAAQRGRIVTGSDVLTSKRKERYALVEQWQRASGILQDMKNGRAAIKAQGAVMGAFEKALGGMSELLGGSISQDRIMLIFTAFITLLLGPAAAGFVAASNARGRS